MVAFRGAIKYQAERGALRVAVKMRLVSRAFAITWFGGPISELVLEALAAVVDVRKGN